MCLNLFETNAHNQGCVASYKHLIAREQYNMPACIPNLTSTFLNTLCFRCLFLICPNFLAGSSCFHKMVSQPYPPHYMMLLVSMSGQKPKKYLHAASRSSHLPVHLNVAALFHYCLCYLVILCHLFMNYQATNCKLIH
jgi:hypothetical protein